MSTETTTAQLLDSTGVELERGMKVTTKDGFKAVIGRLDAKSGRAVVHFERAEGEDAPALDTMRKTGTLTVRKHAGKILRAKEAVKAAAKAKAPVEAPAKPAKAAKAKAPAKPKAAKAPKAEPAPEPVEPVVAELPAETLVITDTDEAVEPENMDELIASLPGDAFQV